MGRRKINREPVQKTPAPARRCFNCVHRPACTMWVGANRISCCDAVKCECFEQRELEVARQPEKICPATKLPCIECVPGGPCAKEV